MNEQEYINWVQSDTVKGAVIGVVIYAVLLLAYWTFVE